MKALLCCWPLQSTQLLFWPTLPLHRVLRLRATSAANLFAAPACSNGGCKYRLSLCACLKIFSPSVWDSLAPNLNHAMACWLPPRISNSLCSCQAG